MSDGEQQPEEDPEENGAAARQGCTPEQRQTSTSDSVKQPCESSNSCRAQSREELSSVNEA